MELEFLEGLDNRQLDAVTSTEGPLLIIAGAGTGKTRVITRRIAYLLRTIPGLKPENILALTYTNKAADEMRERVEALTGLDSSDMFIGTIHSFCNQVIDEAGVHIGLPELRQVDEIEQWIFLEDHLDSVGLDYYLSAANPREVIKDFVRFVSRCKDGMVVPDDYAAYAQKLSDEFEAVKGGMDEKTREAGELEVKRERELARVYRIYQGELLKAGLKDFGDSIIYTIKLFRERPNVLQAYQQRFKYVLIDEFQDTNQAQIEIFAMLAAEHRNICACGDSDQAIYRFRGASFASFNHFMERFPEAKKVRLDHNYRSGRHILSAACRLIDHNGADRFEPAALKAKTGDGEKVAVLVCPDYRDEAKAVAREIDSLYNALPEEERRYRDFAVLYRAHAHKDLLVQELKARGIPFQVSGVGLFERPEVRDLIALLSIVHDYRDSVACARVLISGLVNLPAKDMAHISHRADRDRVPFYQVITAYAELKGVSSEGRDKLAGLAGMLARLERIAAANNVLDFTYEALRISGCIKILLADPSYRQAADNIGALCAFIRSYLEHAVDGSLHGFMRYLERYREAGGNPDQAGIDDDEDAVRLMTVHAAKGLEFPHVFIIGLSSRRFPTANRSDKIPFPDALNKDYLPGADFHKQEERRLCYVAMTRARRKLYLCAIDKKGTNPSPFIKEVDTHKLLMAKADSVEALVGREPDYEILRRSAFEEGVETDVYASGIERLTFEYTRDIVRALHNIPSRIRDKELLGNEITTSIDKLWSIVRLAHLSGKDPGYYREALSDLDSLWPHISAGMLSQRAVFISELGRERVIRALKEIGGAGARPGDAPIAREAVQLRLNATKIECYKKCPRQYYYKYVMNIPGRPSAAPSFGTVVHNALADFYGLTQEGVIPPLEKLIELYEAHWSGEGYESKLQEEEYKKKGYVQLSEYYHRNAANAAPVLALEAGFDMTIGSHLIKGRIDRIDRLDDGSVEIIDYKTGRPKDQKHVDNDLQLGIYALAARAFFGYDPSALSLYYLETNEKITTARTGEQLRAVEREILDCATNILNRKFETNANPAGHCRWCDYKLLCEVYEKR